MTYQEMAIDAGARGDEIEQLAAAIEADAQRNYEQWLQEKAQEEARMTDFMDLGEALAIVYELALENTLNEEYDEELRELFERQDIALNTVHDFIVNNFEEG